MSIRTIARAAAALVMIGCVLGLPGCLEATKDFALQKDGSGTAKVRVVVDLVKAGMLRDFAGIDPEADVAKWKERIEKAPGVRIVKHEDASDEDAETRTVTMELAFDSLDAFVRTIHTEMARASLQRRDDGSWTLTLLYFDEEDHEENPMMAQAEPLLGTFRLSGTWTLPGTVLETTGTKVDEKSVSFAVGFREFLKPAHRRWSVTFKGEDLALEPFGTPVAGSAPASPAKPDDEKDDGDAGDAGDADEDDDDMR